MKKSELREIIREEIGKLIEGPEDLLKKNSSFSKMYGLTTAKLKSGILTIYHTGNMGNSIKDDVNPNLKGMGLPPIEKLKSTFKVISEKGSPDYMYVIKFKI